MLSAIEKDTRHLNTTQVCNRKCTVYSIVRFYK